MSDISKPSYESWVRVNDAADNLEDRVDGLFIMPSDTDMSGTMKHAQETGRRVLTFAEFAAENSDTYEVRQDGNRVVLQRKDTDG